MAQDRLEKRSDGRFELTLKSVWKDGTRAVLFEGQDLMARLIAAIPPPRFHLIRYLGVLSSHSALRSEVVPTPRVDPAAHAPPPAPGDQLDLLTHAADKPPSTPKRWAWLLKHVFAATASSTGTTSTSEWATWVQVSVARTSAGASSVWSGRGGAGLSALTNDC